MAIWCENGRAGSCERYGENCFFVKDNNFHLQVETLKLKVFCFKSIEGGNHIICQWKRNDTTFKVVSLYIQSNAYLNLTLGMQLDLK